MRGPGLLRTAGPVLALMWCQAAAQAYELEGEAIQGGLMFGNCGSGCKVSLDGSEILVSPDGRFVIGFDRDESGERSLRVREADGKERTTTLTVATRDYQIERVDGLPPQTVTPTVQCPCKQGVLTRVAENLPRLGAFPDGVFITTPAKGDVAARAVQRAARPRQNAARIEVLHGCQSLFRRVIVSELDLTLGDADAKVRFLIGCQVLTPHLERLPVRRDGVREASAGASQVTPADRIAEAMEEQRKPGHRTIPPQN